MAVWFFCINVKVTVSPGTAVCRECEQVLKSANGSPKTYNLIRIVSQDPSSSDSNLMVHALDGNDGQRYESSTSSKFKDHREIASDAFECSKCEKMETSLRFCV